MRLIMCLRWPSHDWWMVRTAPSPFLWRHAGLFKLSSEPCFVRTQNHCYMDLWSSWLVLTRHYLHQQLPLHQIPRERVSWLWLRLSFCPFPIRFLGCKELSFNSYLSVIKECSPLFWPPFTWTSLPPGYHKSHLIWVVFGRMVPWARF